MVAPFVIPAVATGVGALGGIGNALFGGNDPNKQLQQIMAMISKFASPGRQAGDISQLYTLLQNSPGFQNVLQSATLSGAAAGNAAERALAATGVNRSGLGALATGVAQTAPQTARAGARADLFGQSVQARTSTMNSLMQLLSFLGQRIDFNQDPLGQVFGGLLAGGAQGLANAPASPSAPAWQGVPYRMP